MNHHHYKFFEAYAYIASHTGRRFCGCTFSTNSLSLSGQFADLSNAKPSMGARRKSYRLGSAGVSAGVKWNNYNHELEFL
jgi:hypothetical protein